MKDIIKQLCNTGELVEVYSNPADSERFATVFIEACSDESFLAHSFQNQDLDDGYYVNYIDAVHRIQRNSIYLNGMLQFIKPKAEQYELPKGYWPDLDLFGAMLSLCQEKRLMTVVRVNNDYNVFGWVRSFDDDILEIDSVDGDGMADGTTYVCMADITLVGFGGVDEERRARLFESWARRK